MEVGLFDQVPDFAQASWLLGLMYSLRTSRAILALFMTTCPFFLYLDILFHRPPILS